MEEEKDYEICSCSEDGEHLPRLDFVYPAEGYTDHEGGIVVDVECRFCGQSGSCKILFEDILW